MRKNNKTKTEFSKVLLIQESALVWVLTIAFIALAFYCISCGYTGSLPWLAAMVSFPWAAYGVSQVFYYQKSTRENTKNGLKFESIMAEVNSLYKTNIQPTIIEENPSLDEDYTIDLDYGI